MKKLSIVLTIGFYFLSWSILFAQKETKTVTQVHPEQSILEWDIPQESELLHIDHGSDFKNLMETSFPGIPPAKTAGFGVHYYIHNTRVVEIDPMYIMLEDDMLLMLGPPKPEWLLKRKRYVGSNEERMNRYRKREGFKLKKSIVQIGTYSFIWFDESNEENSEFSFVRFELGKEYPKHVYSGGLFFRTDERNKALAILKKILKSTRMKTTVTQVHPGQSTIEWDIPQESELLDSMHCPSSVKDYLETRFPGIPSKEAFKYNVSYNQVVIYPLFIKLGNNMLLLLGSPQRHQQELWDIRKYNEAMLARYHVADNNKYKPIEKAVKKIGSQEYIWMEYTNKERDEFRCVRFEMGIIQYEDAKYRYKGCLYFRTDEREEALKKLKEILKSTRMK